MLIRQPFLLFFGAATMILFIRNSEASIQARFHETVAINMTAIVTGPAIVSAHASSSIKYQGGLGHWELDFLTLTTQPYKLSNPTVSVSGIDSSRIMSSTITNTADCNSATAGCSQAISVFISGCHALRGDVTVTVSPACSGGNDTTNCSTIEIGNLNISVVLDIPNSCGVIDELHLQTKSLTSYKYSNLTSSSLATTFNATDVAYFSITTNDSIITDITVDSVCMILNPQHGNTECHTIDFTQISLDSSTSPAFSVALSQTLSLTNASGLHTFTVRATIGITKLGVTASEQSESKSSITTISTNISIDTSSMALPSSSTSDSQRTISAENNQDSQTLLSDDRWKTAVIASVSAVCGLCIVSIVILAVFLHRRRTQKRNAELNFNFSNLVDD